MNGPETRLFPIFILLLGFLLAWRAYKGVESGSILSFLRVGDSYTRANDPVLFWFTIWAQGVLAAFMIILAASIMR